MPEYQQPPLRRHRVDSVFMEIALAQHFNHRTNIILPNLHWGLAGSHYEKDLVVIRPSGYAVEVEIKVSKSDLKADIGKPHGHRSNLMRQLWFAVPDYMDTEDCQAMIPERAGIIVVSTESRDRIFTMARGQCTIRRSAKINKAARPLNHDEILKAAHLTAMRIWGLKETLMNNRIQKKGGWKPI